MRLRRAALRAFLLVLPLLWVSSGRAAAGPAVDLHQLRWYVHVDLIDAAAGRDLAFWQAAIDDAAKGANRLLEGRQGPFDRACCTRITRAANVTTFGSPGDGRDVLDSAAEQNYFNTAGGAGSAAFLIDSITYCGGSAPTAVGCAERPGCDSNGNDNPNLWLVATADAFDSDILAAVVAHERGHNACRQHVATAECQIMQASIFVPGRGGCLTAAECTSYRSARTTTASGQECTCITAAGAIEADATACSGAPLGLCSGGLCGNALGSAGVRLIAAAAPGSAAGGPPDDALAISALSGNWSLLAQFAPTSDDVRALAYAHDSATLFGVVPTVTNDRIVTIDPSTGLITATVGIRVNGALEIVSMAYDPGDTSGPGTIGCSCSRRAVRRVSSGRSTPLRLRRRHCSAPLPGVPRRSSPVWPTTASMTGSSLRRHSAPMVSTRSISRDVHPRPVSRNRSPGRASTGTTRALPSRP